ncbi:hypothetical protein AKJ16_DCAP01656 [Drosera capensis]
MDCVCWMFVLACKRLRIMRSSKVKGLDFQDFQDSHCSGDHHGVRNSRFQGSGPRQVFFFQLAYFLLKLYGLSRVSETSAGSPIKSCLCSVKNQASEPLTLVGIIYQDNQF